MYPSLEETMPELYQELNQYQHQLEQHFRNMQDMEFTIQEGKLWILQTRNGKRTGAAMVKSPSTSGRKDSLPTKKHCYSSNPISWMSYCTLSLTQKLSKNRTSLHKDCPLHQGSYWTDCIFLPMKPISTKQHLGAYRNFPEDLEGMNLAKGILTARGGMTSHAAVVARGMGKCCITGAGV